MYNKQESRWSKTACKVYKNKTKTVTQRPRFVLATRICYFGTLNRIQNKNRGFHDTFVNIGLSKKYICRQSIQKTN